MTRAWCICFTILAGFLLASGQSTTSLRGVVTDPTGAVIPGAVVTLTNNETGFKRQGLSGEDGVYQFLQTPPGTYQVKAEKDGFATVTREGVQLQINTPARWICGWSLEPRRTSLMLKQMQQPSTQLMLP